MTFVCKFINFKEIIKTRISDAAHFLCLVTITPLVILVAMERSFLLNDLTLFH